MLHFDTIDVSEGNDVNKTNKLKECVFVTIGIFQIKALNFNKISAINVMIYQ